MKISYTGFIAIPNKQWKCDMILELTDCMYGFSNCGLSYEDATYCPCHHTSVFDNLNVVTHLVF